MGVGLKRTITRSGGFGWQRPCYLLVGEGYAQSFRSLMEDTPWERYGLGNNQKCNQCQVHCGFEPTAVQDTFMRPWSALLVHLKGPRTEGAFAPDLADGLAAAPIDAEPEASGQAAI